MMMDFEEPKDPRQKPIDNIVQLSQDDLMARRQFIWSCLAASGLWVLSPSLAPAQTAPADRPRARQQALVNRAGHVRVQIASGTRHTLTPVCTLDVNGQRISPGDTLEIRAMGGEVVVTSRQRTVASAQTIVCRSLSRADEQNGAFRIGGTAYRGEAHLVSRGGTVQVINDVFIDDWLKGLIGAEIGNDAPMEALKAQAVSARSEACYKLLRPPHAAAGFDFCNGVHCQAYKGMSRENAATIQACETTAGLIIAAEGDIVDAVYSNLCGGITALPEDVWDTRPGRPGYGIIRDGTDRRAPNLSTDSAASRFLRSNAGDIFCDSSNPNYPRYAQKYWRWSVQRNASQLQRAFGVGEIRELGVSERKNSGTVWSLTAIGVRGSRTLTKELTIRRALDLWSGFFVVEPVRSGGFVTAAVFHGGGNGHGVGMCQQGARQMAGRGMSFVQILRHYYPGTSIERLYRITA
jgi:SpoIID/LytB domain protein